MAKGRDVEKSSWKSTKTSIFLSHLSTDLPMKKDPIATKMSQLARMIPRVSSLPRKEMRSSLNRMTCATIPLSPMMNSEILRVNLLMPYFIINIFWVCKECAVRIEMGR
jgi:hypothetical protein